MSCSATAYHKVNSSIVSKGAMNSVKEMFPLARMFLLAVMHTSSCPALIDIRCGLFGHV